MEAARRGGVPRRLGITKGAWAVHFGMSATTTALSALTLGVVPLQGGSLLWLAIVFFVLALLAAVAGFRGVAGISMEIARILVFVFIVLAIIAFLL